MLTVLSSLLWDDLDCFKCPPLGGMLMALSVHLWGDVDADGFKCPPLRGS